MTGEIVLIPVLVGLAVIGVGGALILSRYARRAPIVARLNGIAGGELQAPASENAPWLAQVVGDIGTAVTSGKASITLKEQLTQAGYHEAGAAAVYIGAKMILLVVGVLASLVLVAPASIAPHLKFFIVGAAGFLLFLLPNMVVSARRSSRQKQIRRHLPDAIDLLEVCASAGMGLDMAWNSVTDEVRPVSQTLADEMALTNLEIHLGATRADAMRHMAQRTGADDLSSLVAVLVQSERFGTSIADALQTFATSMREVRSQTAQESAEKMAVKLIFPMVVFIFPACILIMAGPAFLALLKAFHH